MGKRGPKPTREPTTHIRVPVGIANALRNAADARHISIAILMDSLKDKLLVLLPMPPRDGPPLPRGMGIKWPSRTRKRR